MAQSILKRLSVSINERMGLRDDGATPRALASSTSFNDFSLHVGHEVDESHGQHAGAEQSTPASAIPAPPAPLMSSSAPTSFGGLSASTALKIPRSPMAHLLYPRGSTDSGTPRSSLDLSPSSAAPTPRSSLSYPRSPAAAGLGGAADEPASPRSPRSPTTPGGRRRKQPKIDGMDYYEFCELIRSSSL